MVIGVVMAQARRISLGHLAINFCRSCTDEEEEETVLYLLGTCPALCYSRKIHLGAYYIHNLSNLSNIDIDSLCCFIISFRWFQDYGIVSANCDITMGSMGPKSVHPVHLGGRRTIF